MGIIEQINGILNNEAYAQYFAQSDNLKQLKLSPENLSGKKARDDSVFCLESPKSYSALVCGLRIPTPSPSSDSTESDHHDRNRNHNGFPLCSPSPSRSPAKGVRRNLCLAFLTPSPSPAKRKKKSKANDESTAKKEGDIRKEREEDNFKTSPARGVRRKLSLAFLASPSPSPAKRRKKNRSEDESTAQEEADEEKEREEDDEEDDNDVLTSRKAFDFD